MCPPENYVSAQSTGDVAERNTGPITEAVLRLSLAKKEERDRIIDTGHFCPVICIKHGAAVLP